MAGFDGPSQKPDFLAEETPEQRTTKLFFDERGLWRVVSRLDGCFPDVNLTRRPGEAESAFRRRVMQDHSGILNACRP